MIDLSYLTVAGCVSVRCNGLSILLFYLTVGAVMYVRFWFSKDDARAFFVCFEYNTASVIFCEVWRGFVISNYARTKKY